MKLILIVLVSLPIAAFLGGVIGGLRNYRKVFGKNRTPSSIVAFILTVTFLSAVF